MEREARSFAYGELPDGYILRSRLGQVIGMIEWNEQRLEELVRRMKLQRAPEQEKTPIHLSLYYGPYGGPEPLLAQVMRLGTTMWLWMGYDETDRVSAIRYLGSLECRTDRALWAAVQHQPLSLDLAKLLVDAGCDPAAQNGNGWDVLVHLAWGDHPVLPQVTDLFLSAGCRTDLGGCSLVSNEQRIRFDQILEEHALWKESLDRTSAENVPADLAVDWGL